MDRHCYCICHLWPVLKIRAIGGLFRIYYTVQTHQRPTGRLKAEAIRELSEPAQSASSPTYGGRGGGRQTSPGASRHHHRTLTAHPYRITVKPQVRDGPLDQSTPRSFTVLTSWKCKSQKKKKKKTEASPPSRAPCIVKADSCSQGSRTLRPILLIARIRGNLSRQSTDRKPWRKKQV